MRLNVMSKLLNVIVSLLLTSFILLGCGSMEKRDLAEAFRNQTRAYEKAIRWREYGLAAGMREPRKGTVEPFDPDRFKEIRVTRYQVTRREFTEDNKEATVTAIIDFYHERENRVKTITDRQSWWYDEEKERWFLDGDLPAFLQ
jgi:hypothetical protein